MTGVDTDWTAPGWRTSRAAEADPWSATSSARDLEGAIGIGAAGELSVGGLEWLGARVYDPASRGFLSTDPIEATTGAGWSGNPYSYAGNDPLHALDPTGLHPVTDAELAAYRDSNGIGGTFNTVVNATGNWLQNNWEYVAGGAAIIAGGVLIATGVGGPVGLMLISAGADTIIQKATTGEVNWGQVGVSFVAGGIGGGFAAAKLGATGLKGAMMGGAASGGIGGAGMGAYQYGTGPGPHTVGGYLGATAGGGVNGAIFGSLGGAASHGAGSVATKMLGDAAPTPLVPTPHSGGDAGALVRYDPQAASRTLLGQVGDGYAVTPGGRTVSAHAAERIALGAPGRAPTTLERVDDILDNPTKLRYDPVRDTVRVSQEKDFAVVSGTGPDQHIVTAMVRG